MHVLSKKRKLISAFYSHPPNISPSTSALIHIFDCTRDSIRQEMMQQELAPVKT